MTPMFLTPDELADLTEAQQRRTQERELVSLGIPYRVVRGRIKVLRSVVEAKFGAQTAGGVAGPNWGAWNDRASKEAA